MSTDTYMVKYRLNVSSVAIGGHGIPFRRCRNHPSREIKDPLPFGISRPRDNYSSSARDTQRTWDITKTQLEASSYISSSARATQRLRPLKILARGLELYQLERSSESVRSTLEEPRSRPRAISARALERVRELGP